MQENKHKNNNALCSLCQQPLSKNFLINDFQQFCCSGCQAVFNILSIRGETDDYENSPLFLQAVHSGLISNPTLLEQLRDKSKKISKDECVKFYFEVADMWCPSCAEVIRLILLREKGVKNCHIDYATDMASVEFSPKIISKEKIFKKIGSLGYRPNSLEDKSVKPINQSLYVKFIVAAFCAFNSMMFSYPLYATYFDSYVDNYNHFFAWLSFWISLPVVSYTGWPIFRRFWSSFCVGLLGMESLVTIGVFSAFFLSTYELFTGSTKVYFDSMTVIVAFVLLGKIIENKTKFSAKEALFRLNLSLPKRGRKLFIDGSSLFVPIKDLAVGDLIEVRMGELIILDGIVTEGEGLCNESLMTGEPIPSNKVVGSKVIGGTVLQHGRLVVRVTNEATQSTLQHIVNIIEQQIHEKQAYIRPADKIARWFVPFVLSIAALTMFTIFIFSLNETGKSVHETAFLRAISILLISCPCAIGIAAPTAESGLIHALAQKGAIVRNRGSLRHLGEETCFVFDKTGTITQGSFTVILGLDLLSIYEKQILKGMVEKSNHPIAKAIWAAIDLCPITLDSNTEYSGKGILASVNGVNYFLGSSKWMIDQQVKISLEAQQEEMRTVVYFAKRGKEAQALILGDELKADSMQAIKDLGEIKTFLVSGDTPNCVAYLAKKCGFKGFLSQASPLEKQQFIEKLKKEGEIVGMVGDGVNDSPALACSNVGISVTTATDVSIQVSDILLTTDKLEVIAKIRHLAKKGHKILKQNLFWAFFYNIIGIGLAVFGCLSPIFAAFAMTASSLIVLLNAMRIK